MKTRYRPGPKLLLALLLALATAPVLASEHASVQFGAALGKIAQFSPEERRALRERWEQAGPEERLRLRREFLDRQERMRQPPFESRGEMVEQWKNPTTTVRDRGRGERESRGQRGENTAEGSFGTGFERRRFDDERFAPPAPMPNPGDFFGRRHNRDGDRP
jgi:hypothetical protein